MDIGEIEWGDVDWIGVTQDRVQPRVILNAVMNVLVP
jgi:hypothetical protein